MTRSDQQRRPRLWRICPREDQLLKAVRLQQRCVAVHDLLRQVIEIDPHQAHEGVALVVGAHPLSGTHSRCEPLAVARHFVAGIGQQPFGLASEFFMQVRLLFENGVDI